jgi:integrase
LRHRLTDLAVEKLKAPSVGRVELWDSLLPGFGLRIGKNGKKTWVVMYRLGGREARKQRLTLGSYPKLSLAKAREHARDALAQVGRGIDPALKVKQLREADTFEEVATQFIERYAKPKNKGWKEQQRDIERDLLPYWRRRRINSITRNDILEVLDRVIDRASPVSANRLLGLIRKLFNWCLERGILEVSPAASVKPPGKEQSRDRVLSDEELRYVWSAACDLGYPFGSVVRLLLVTAQRRDEVGTMRWQDLDLEKSNWTVPREISKNGVANEVPLSRLALDIIRHLPRFNDEEYVFPAANGSGRPASGYGKAKRKLDERIHARRRADSAERPMPPWWLHDLRRTAASSMARLGTPPHTIERVLNHVSGSRAGVAGVYNRYGYQKEKQQALELWSNHVETVVREKERKP